MSNPVVIHPRDVLERERALVESERHWLVNANDRLLDWVAQHVLGSILMFDLAMLVPLVAIPAPDSVKFLVAIISGSWIQLWALFALQRSAMKVQAQQDAKADADHRTLSHLASQVDGVLQRLGDPQHP